jgi:hypothetical protein
MYMWYRESPIDYYTKSGLNIKSGIDMKNQSASTMGLIRDFAA